MKLIFYNFLFVNIYKKFLFLFLEKLFNLFFIFVKLTFYLINVVLAMIITFKRYYIATIKLITIVKM